MAKAPKHWANQIAQQMGVAGGMHQTKGKTRSTTSKHVDMAKGPIMPPSSAKGTVKGGGKSRVEAMKKSKKMKTKGKANKKMHSNNKTRTKHTKMNYGKAY